MKKQQVFMIEEEDYFRLKEVSFKNNISMGKYIRDSIRKRFGDEK